jgi:hypothetical protein
MRVYLVSHLLDVRLTDRPFARPPDFDLARFWQTWCTEEEQHRVDYRVTVRVSPELIEWLPHYLGVHARAAIADAGPADQAGWITLQLGFESLPAARERLLGLGRAVEVLEPRALRLSMVDFAHQIVDLYASSRA